MSESNIVPSISVQTFQQDKQVSAIAKDLGEVTLSLTIEDPNFDDQHIINWELPAYIHAQISANQKNVYLDPTLFELPTDIQDLLSISVQVKDNGDGELTQVEFVHIPVFEQHGRLDGSDTDLDGIPDNIEGFHDEDDDGIPAFLDRSTISHLQQLHVNSARTKIVETEPGLKLSLGKYAKQQFSDGIQLSANEIVDTQLIQADDYTHLSDYFDFEVSDIQPVGSSINIILPMNDGIPEFPLYRKFSEALGWQNFVEDSNNSLSSAQAIDGVCPTVNSELYQHGLTAGDNCIQLLIEDGGPNDADGIANGTIDDPGVVAIVPNKEIAKETDPEKSSSGGGLFWFLIVGLSLLVIYRKVVKPIY